MQKQKLDILPPKDILKSLEQAFTTIPIVPRDCVKALNQFSYNFQHQEFPQEIYKNMLFLILRGFTSKDNYLKSLIYAILDKIASKYGDGILSLNSILKDIDDKSIPFQLKNSAYRSLFSNLPDSMKFDFEKFIKMALLDDKSRDNSVCIASEYFKDIKVDNKVFDRIDDYHTSFFNKLPINKYSGMLEIKKLKNADSDISKVSQYLTSSTDSVIFFEAAKLLTKVKQEVAANYIDKAVSVLKQYLSQPGIQQLVSIRILNQFSVNFPHKVAKANKEIENLIQSSSKTVGMLAILTLLKTGTDETARDLAKKLEPLMHTMSEPYKIMAIETIEKLTKGSKDDLLIFLKNSVTDKGTVKFKRFILRKIENILKDSDSKTDVVKFLCSYMEDPEYFQINMDILGLVGPHINNPKDLIHVYNRIILDNTHVRNSVYQTLYDMNNNMNTIDILKTVNDPDTLKFRNFLISNSHLSRDSFNLSELGDMEEEVTKYLKCKEVTEQEVEYDSFIKECRPVDITEKGSDIKITLIKKISEDKINLTFLFENNMNKVHVASGILSLVEDDNKYCIKLNQDDFRGSNPVVKEIEVDIKENCTFNGVFEYKICLEDDLEETEDDSVAILPFDINCLDFIRPISVSKMPEKAESIELKFKLNPTEAISKIVTACNMFLYADKNSFELQGVLDKTPVVIKGEVVYTKYSTVRLYIFCDDDSIVTKIVSVFD